MTRLASMWPLWALLLSPAVASMNGTNSTSHRLPKNGTELYLPLFEVHSNSTPRFINSTGETANPLIKALQDKNRHNKRHIHSHMRTRAASDLPEGTCAPGTPCVNGACCSKTGICGFSPAECGSGNCISNCNATAPCGQYAKPEDKQCPLNVCCSFYGFCGSTDLFCTTTGDKQCQKGYGSCGAAPRPSCNGGDSTSERVIGYYESWATTRACDKRQPEDIDLTAFTHLNFAFAFFDPKTFQMAPMSAGDQNLYRRFTGLKSKKPSLRTWIAVGGWSFNDPTNIPNTRTAFSDMVSSSANRKAFISSLSQFLQTYGFDGVDLDWEYPSADDRGGVKADKVNLNTFLKELKQAFGGRYGISITLPASYWYLQGFDVKTIQYYVDWMNVMSYDIHGVWDQGNVHTGPYVRPHTNITEIEEGLDLLWRAGVDSSKVVLGLGWYGRSFTLANPACSTPNGICIFSQGGNPGECTNSAGTLTNSEINRIISRAGVTKGFDKKAAVKWITWNTNQWVSYDDGETMQLKVAFANSRCLGGKMVWAVDQDDEQGSSSNDLLGIGPANGVSADVAQKIKDKLNDAAESAAVASSCYWTFCGERCTSGYFPATGANGQISGIQRDTECPKDSPQTLCCAPGTIMGACTWEGWRGVGLACAPVCKDTNATIVARNSNPEDRNCNGGYQAYCCSGFVPSSKTNTGGLALIGQGGLAKREEGSGEYGLVLGERGVKGGVNGLALGLPICAAIITLIEVIASLATAGLSLAGTPALYAVCMGIATVLGFIASGLSHMLQTFTNFFFPSDPGNIGTPVGNQLGQWQKLDFGGAQTGTTSCDCHVTYTCVYGRGYDEICDNQRWAIDQTLGGNTVYHSTRRQNNNQYSKYLWANGARHAGFRTAAQVIPAGGNMARCQVDEFPQGALAEGVWPNPQLVRLVNGPANNAQGVDYGQWLWAQFKPCSVYRKDVCHLATPAPPITWKFSNMGGGRKSTAGQNFIKAYGFDSQTPGSLCWATFTHPRLPQGGIVTSTVEDHFFRVLPDDPMFAQYGFPFQVYRTSPDTPYPTSQASAQFLKREVDEPALDGVNEGHLMYIDDSYIWEGVDYTPAPTVTSTTVDAAPETTSLTKARTRVESPGPLETAAAEEQEELRRYL